MMPAPPGQNAAPPLTTAVTFGQMIVTANVFVTANGGMPVSVATVVRLVVTPMKSPPGIQVMVPLVSTLAPVGGVSSE